MRDLPPGIVTATISICAAVIAVCVACVVAWWPSIRYEARELFEDDVEPVIRHGAPPAHVVNFRQHAAKGFGARKGRSS